MSFPFFSFHHMLLIVVCHVHGRLRIILGHGRVDTKNLEIQIVYYFKCCKSVLLSEVMFLVKMLRLGIHMPV